MKDARWIKVMALLLAMLMLLPMALACKKEEAEDDETTVTTTPDDGDSLYDENGYLKDSLPDLDFDKYMVRTIGWENEINSVDYWAEAITGDVADDAIYWRTKKVEDRLNIVLWETRIPGNYDHYDRYVATVSQKVMSGTREYDIVASYSIAGGIMAAQGLCFDLNSLDYIDFEKPWWSQAFKSALFGDKMYFATGELAKTYLYALHCMVINKTMLSELQLSDPRQMVIDGTWTYDKLYEITENVGANLDRDTNKSAGDRFGFLTWNNTSLDAFVVGAGINISTVDGEGVLQLTEDFVGEKTHKLVTDLSTRFYQTVDWAIEGNDSLTTTSSFQNIVAGKTLIGALELGQCLSFAEQDAWAFGVVPFPMWNTDQGSYYTNLDYDYTLFSIPLDAKDPDMSAAVLECMNSEAYRSSSPVYFETVMKGSYAHDELDPQMYNIIKSGVIVDATRIYSGVIAAGEAAPMAFRKALSKPGAIDSWMSTADTFKETYNGLLTNLGNTLKDLAQNS